MSYEKLTPASPEAQSESPVADHVNALASLFPSVVREGKVDFDALRQILGDDVVKDDELFGLQWKGKAQARRAATIPSLGTLRPCKEESVDWNSTKNLYLEGDNLEVLKLLRKSYASKVKMIYIDPPYNTGKDFVYPDNYQNSIEEYKKLTGQLEGFKANAETSGRYHTNWLNMMYPRLVLAKDLLSDDGVICISIDENEITNLRCLCDTIFGENNFLFQITLLCNPKGRSQDKYIANCHEYILGYSKNELPKGSLNIKKDEKDINNDYKLIDEIGRYRELELRNTHRDFGQHNRQNLYYPIFVNELGKISLENILGYTAVFPDWEDGFKGCWTWSIDKATKQLNELVAKKIKGNWKIYRKNYAETADGTSTKQVKSIWIDKGFHTEKGQSSFNELFQTTEKIFQSPKSIETIRQLVLMGARENSIILDFFSGSATTAHSILLQNAIDNGKRRFVMVQIPEPCAKDSAAERNNLPTICDIAKERIRRAGKKIKEEAGLQGQHLDVGFRVYKLDSSNLRIWNPEVDNLELALGSYEKHLLPGRTQEDLLYELLLKQGIELTEDARIKEFEGKRVYSLGHGQYYACMETVISSDQIESLALEIAQWKQEESPDNTQCAVFVIDEAFRTDADKLNFSKILEQHGIPFVKAL